MTCLGSGCSCSLSRVASCVEPGARSTFYSDGPAHPIIVVMSACRGDVCCLTMSFGEQSLVRMMMMMMADLSFAPAVSVKLTGRHCPLRRRWWSVKPDELGLQLQGWVDNRDGWAWPRRDGTCGRPAPMLLSFWGLVPCLSCHQAQIERPVTALDV